MEKGIFLKDFEDDFKLYFDGKIDKSKKLRNNILLAYVPNNDIESKLKLRIRINKYQNEDLIVVSPSLDVAKLAWKIGADQFAHVENNDLYCNSTFENINYSIDQVQNISPSLLDRISFKFTEGTFSYSLKDILYIKAEGSYSIITSRTGKSLPISKKLKEIDDKVCNLPNFYRFNRSYIFNLNNIIQIEGRKITFDNDTVVEFPKYGTSFVDLKEQLLWSNI